jgi:Cu+-exporting ATPase
MSDSTPPSGEAPAVTEQRVTLGFSNLLERSPGRFNPAVMCTPDNTITSSKSSSATPSASERRFMATQLDPVCGMSIEEKDAAGTTQFGGRTYYFCHPSCKTAFDQNPQKFVIDKPVAARR